MNTGKSQINALEFRTPLILLCSVLNLSNFSWCKHTLALLMLVCSFSLFSCLFLHYFFLTFSFLFLHLHALSILSYVMIIFYVLKKLSVLRI